MKCLAVLCMVSTLVFSVSVIKGYKFDVYNQTGDKIDIRLSVMTIWGPVWHYAHKITNGNKNRFSTGANCFNVKSVLIGTGVDFIQIRPSGSEAWINIPNKEKRLIACRDNSITIEKLQNGRYLYR